MTAWKMAVNYKNILVSKHKEPPLYFAAQLLGWLAMSVVWLSVIDAHQAVSDPADRFIEWIVVMYISGCIFSHFFLRSFYWWLSRKPWLSAVKIAAYIVVIELSVWGLVLAERVLLLFVPIPFESLGWSWLNILVLYHIIMVFWALVYHYWVWERACRDSLPIENAKYYVLSQYLGWFCVGVFWYLLYTGRGKNVEINMDFFWPWVLKICFSGILLSHVFLRPFNRSLLNLKTNFLVKLLLSIVGIYVCTNLGELTSFLWLDWSNLEIQERTSEENMAGIAVSFVSFCIWSLLYGGWLTWQQKIDETTRRLKLEVNYKEAQMSGLKQQLNPHFIFNALNSLRALIIQDQHVARKMVTEISNLLRYTLYESEKDVVPLAQEIEIVKDYLAIELLRYDGRISIKWDIPDHLLLTPVVPLCIQTLVENAIKHTINQYDDGIFIHIEARDNSRNTTVSVCNRGKICAHDESGIGLRNTRERLILVFGAGSSLVLQQKEDEVVEAVVTIPKGSTVEKT